MDKTRIARALSEAALRMPLGIFGEAAHGYELNRPVDEPAIEGFEVRWSTRLPKVYREFLLTIGNGGAGPYYGLFAFLEMDSGHEHKTFAVDGDLVGAPSTPFPYTDRSIQEPPLAYDRGAFAHAWR